MESLTTTTFLADDLEIEAECIKLDQSIKNVLATMPILAYTVKCTVTEVGDMSMADIEASIDHESIEVSSVRVNPGLSNSKAVLLNCQDSVKNEGTVYYDIRFVMRLPDGSQTKIIVNVEAQRKSNPGYSIVKRGIFYVARLISAQLGVEFSNKGEDKAQYDNIKKVYSIWICMDCPNDKKDSIVSYTLQPNVLYSGNANLNIDYPYDLLNVTLVHLNDTYDKSNNELIGMMDILLSNMAVDEKRCRLETEHSIPMTMELDKEMIAMCNISAGVVERSINEGMAKGMAKGIAIGEARGESRGEARGIEKNRTEMIQSMLREKASVDFIAKVAKLTKEQIIEIGKQASLL